MTSTGLDERKGFRLLIESAQAADWRGLLPTSAFSGVIVDPPLLHRVGLPCSLDQVRTLSLQAFAQGSEELHLHAWGATTESVVELGLVLAAIDPRVVVRVTATRFGFDAAARLIAEGARVALVGIFGPLQAMAAAAMEAAYAVPALDRLIEAGRHGLAEVTAIHEVCRAGGSQTRVMVSGLERLDDAVTLARTGITAFALTPALAEELFEDPLTAVAAAAFAAAAQGDSADEP